jgi:hypothetical protein
MEIGTRQESFPVIAIWLLRKEKTGIIYNLSSDMSTTTLLKA